MADDGSAQSKAIWPLVRFQFQVKWDNIELVFQEGTGLNVEAQPIEYRGGNSKVYATVKMPAIEKYSSVTREQEYCDCTGMNKGTRLDMHWLCSNFLITVFIQVRVAL